MNSSEGNSSEWSKPIEVVLLPYTPKMIIRGLSGNTVQVEWSQKRNDALRKTIDGYVLSYGYVSGFLKRDGQSYRANAVVFQPQLQEKYSFAMLALVHQVKEYT